MNSYCNPKIFPWIPMKSPDFPMAFDSGARPDQEINVERQRRREEAEREAIAEAVKKKER